MSQRCIIHRVLAGECDANEVSIEALHASLSRMMTTFVLHPSAPLADTIGRMFGVLAGHDGRFGAVEGVDVYARMAVVWQGIAIDQLPAAERQAIGRRAVH